MIICNKHPQKFVDPHCGLQKRITRAWMDAQADGDTVFIAMVDRDDPDHVALCIIDMENDQRRHVLRAFGFHADGRPLEGPG